MTLITKGKILWAGCVETVNLDSWTLKDLGWTDEEIKDFMNMVLEDIEELI